jgi:hypothetical protein
MGRRAQHHWVGKEGHREEMGALNGGFVLISNIYRKKRKWDILPWNPGGGGPIPAGGKGGPPGGPIIPGGGPPAPGGKGGRPREVW